MPDPVTSRISLGDFDVYDPDHDDMRAVIVKSADQLAHAICAHPQGLLSGALCNDPTAVSNACRKAESGTITDYICDDKNLQGVQETVQRATWDVLKNLVASALFGRSLK